MSRPAILCISGSARTGSTNTALLAAIARHNADLAQFTMAPRIDRLPVFSPDREGDLTPSEVVVFANQVGAADGLLFAVPEYAHGIPGGLKNALDWLVSRAEFPDKPLMMVHASVRSGVSRAALAEVLRTMSGRLVSEDGLTLHLMGKSADEQQALLNSPEVRCEMRRTVEIFVRAMKETK